MKARKVFIHNHEEGTGTSSAFMFKNLLEAFYVICLGLFPALVATLLHCIVTPELWRVGGGGGSIRLINMTIKLHLCSNIQHTPPPLFPIVFTASDYK